MLKNDINIFQKQIEFYFDLFFFFLSLIKMNYQLWYWVDVITKIMLLWALQLNFGIF